MSDWVSVTLSIPPPRFLSVGSRLARSGLQSAYGLRQDTLGPRVSRAAWTDARSRLSSIRVEFTDVGSLSGIELHNTTGFEVLVPAPRPSAGIDVAHPLGENGAHPLGKRDALPPPGTWVTAKIVSHDKTSVTIGPAPTTGTRLRYLWYGNACGLSCFQCAVYAAVAPLGDGTLSGELPFLPLAPFIMDLPSHTPNPGPNPSPSPSPKPSPKPKPSPSPKPNPSPSPNPNPSPNLT